MRKHVVMLMTFSDCVGLCTFSRACVRAHTLTHTHTRMKNRTCSYRGELPHAVRAHTHTHTACDGTRLRRRVLWPKNAHRVHTRLRPVHDRSLPRAYARSHTRTHIIIIARLHRMHVCVCRACAYPIIINVPGTVHNSPRVQQHSLCATTALQMRWQRRWQQQQPPPAVVASNANEYTFHTLHSNFDTVNLLRSLDRNVARDMSDFIYAIAKSIANCVKLLFSKTHNFKP